VKDAIVIGAGLSGLLGALVLAEAGHRPLLLAKGQGTTHWTGGTIDVWGASGEQPLKDALHRVMQERPHHPYARLGMEHIEPALQRFRSLMETAGYPYAGSLERNVLLPTALGALRPTAFMPVTMVAGDVRQPGEMLLVGFHELRDFFPPLIAANLNAQGIAARGVYLEVPKQARRLEQTTRSFANLFDNQAFRQQIAEQLRSLKGSATRIGFPAVLGLRRPLEAVQELQTLTGAQVFEIPTLPPSIPGLRLFNIFRDAIAAAGGRLQVGSEVLRSTDEGQKLTALYTEAAARQQEHRARGFLLATGGVAGGGIRTDYKGEVREATLGLPLHKPAAREEWFASRFLHAEGHPIFGSGVLVDQQMRPTDESGTLLYNNVVVAGQALACDDPVQDRCTTGLALATGWRAAHLLSHMLRSNGA
jgi:glycerol-3-phosphate dehydrogenase subunit B